MVLACGISSAEVRSLGKAPSGRVGCLPTLTCLVVSGDEGFRKRLHTMSELGGYESCDLPTNVADLRHAIDGDYQLVVVDIARPVGDRINDTIEMAEEFAARPGTLLVVCGSEDSVDEELWARQLGAWVYLPGVSSSDALMSLFAEARRISDRRFQIV